MRRGDLQEEEKEVLERFEHLMDEGQTNPIEQWFRQTKPWETSLVFGITMLQITEKYKGTEWWDTWATTWVLVHRAETTHILAAGLVPDWILTVANNIRDYDNHCRQQDLLRPRPGKKRWHMLGER